MSGLELVGFQKSKPKSQFKSMNSNFVRIKMSENPTLDSTSTQNLTNRMENAQNIGTLTGGRKTVVRKRTLLCLVLTSVVLFVLVMSMTLAMAKGNAFGSGTDEKSAVTFPERNKNSTHSKTGGAHKSLLPSSKHQEITNEASSGINQVKTQLEAQNENVHIRDVRKTVDDLRGQIMTLHQNGSLEMKSLHDELLKQISLLKDEIKSQLLNLSVNSSAPPAPPPLVSITTAPPTPVPAPALSTPRFYDVANYKIYVHPGTWFEPSSGWEKKCVDMPEYFDNVASSVNLGGHCLLVCPEKGCTRKITTHTRSGKECIQLHPKSYGLEKFSNIQFDNQIRSFRLCQKKK